MKIASKLGTERLIVLIGVFAGAFVGLSGIMPEITGFERIYCANEPSNPECVLVTREVFAGIPRPIIVAFYLSVSVAILCSFWLFSQRTKNYSRGSSDNRASTRENIRRRVGGLYAAISMKTLMRDRAAGIMHSFIYFGFLGLLISTTTLEIDHQLPLALKFLQGTT